MGKRSAIDRVERFLRRHEGSGGTALVGLLLILLAVGLFAVAKLGGWPH